MIHHPCKAVLFDLDGTMIQTDMTFERVLSDMGVLKHHFDRTARFLCGIDWRALIEYLFCGQAVDFDRLRLDFITNYEKNAQHSIYFYPGVKQCLDRLKQYGYQVGIITNKDHELCSRYQQLLGDRIDFFLGSGVIGFKKPHPAPLLYAAKMLNLDPRECLYVGDMPSDMTAAHWAGMTGIYAKYGLYHQFDPYYSAKESIEHLEELVNILIRKEL